MTAVIVYESHFGNTKIVAEAIAAELEATGHRRRSETSATGIPNRREATSCSSARPSGWARCPAG